MPGKGETAHVGLDHVIVRGAHKVARWKEVLADPGRGDASGVGGVKIDVYQVGVGLDPGAPTGFLDKLVVVVKEKEEGDTGGGWHVEGVGIDFLYWYRVGFGKNNHELFSEK